MCFFSLLHFEERKKERGGRREEGGKERTGEIFSLVAEEMGGRGGGMGQICAEKWTKPLPEGMLRLPAQRAPL